MEENNIDKPHERWPEGAIVYQIYPRSFQDSNADGIGDIRGIESRIPYLKELGVNAVWVSPFYPSPMADFGYDVSDYCAIDPIFGSLEDFDSLLRTAEADNIKVLIDFVPNHTSDEHEWFKDSRQSHDNPYADWYIWRDAHPASEPGQPLPPNNWRDALTGESAWEWEPAREQFYLHSFHKKQPDLNWSNRIVHEFMRETMRFWLRRGVDGFRVDAVYWMGKDPLFRDDSGNPEYVEGIDPPYEAMAHNNSRGQPAMYAYLAQMAEVLKESEFSDKPRFMTTESTAARHNPVGEYLTFYAAMDPLVAAPFNFEGIAMEWKAPPWHRFLKNFHTNLLHLGKECVASYAFGNHDQPRLASRIGAEAARSAGVLLLTLPGMVFVYNGDELGMENVAIPLDKVQDPAAKGDPVKGQGRDPERTPMQWSSEPNAGFTTAPEPWLPFAPNHQTQNVEVQSGDPDSFLSLYRRLGQLRNNTPSLKHGAIKTLDIDNEAVLGFVRHHENDDSYLTLINFSDENITVNLPLTVGRLVISSVPQTGLNERQAGAEVALSPYEGALFVVEKDSN